MLKKRNCHQLRQCFPTAITNVFRAVALLLAATIVAQGAEQPSIVAIVKGDNPDQMVAEAIDLCGGLKDLIRDGRSVVIKPNLTGLRDGQVYPGQTTDVRVGAALIKALKKAGDCRLSFAEGLNGGRIWDRSGFAELAQKEGVALTNLVAGNFVPVQIDGLALKEYRFPEVIKNCDVFIDLPVMKTHRLTGISAGMKNLYGLLPMPRDVHHGEAEQVVSDLITIRKPDLVVVDALVAMEGQGPLDGTSVTMNLIIAGRDIVAVDSVCAAIMGFDPAQVAHLKYAHERGLGEMDLKKIIVKGLPIAQVQRKFKPANWYIRLEMPGTPEVPKRIASLADKVTLIDSGLGGQQAEFNAGRLKVDREKYPNYESPAFTVVTDRRARKVRFEAQYVVPSLINRPATEAGLRSWIKENLGALTDATPVTTPMGAYP